MYRRYIAAILSTTCATAPVVAQRADTLVRNAGRPLHAGVATLTQHLSIGLTDGADEYMFGRIEDVAVGRDGTIYVVDESVPIVRAYDAAGKFIRNFGRKGQGPGEYSSIAGLNVLSDGRVILWDLGTWRINVYAPTGAVLDHWPTGGSGSSDVSGHDFVTLDTADNVYLMKTVHEMRTVTAGRGGTVSRPDYSTQRTIWIRRRAGTGVLDTLNPPPRPSQDRVMRAVSPAGNSSVSSTIPYDPMYVLSRSPLGYFVSGFSNRYAFELNFPDGRVVSIRRAVQPEPASDAERENARRVTTARMRGFLPAWSWDGPDVPKTKPLFTGLAVGADGRIWVNVTPPQYKMPEPGAPAPGGGRTGGGRGPPRMVYSSCATGEPTVHDVFEPDGTYVGRVQVPAGLDLYVRRGDFVWGEICADDDIPNIRRYRIDWR